MKKIFLGVILSMTVISLTGCGSNQNEAVVKAKPQLLSENNDTEEPPIDKKKESRERVINEIELTDAQLPINMGMLGEMVSMSYNDENETVDVEVRVAESNYVDMMKKNAELAKNSIMLTFAKSDKEYFLNNMVDAGLGTVYIYKAPTGNKELRIEISNEELVQLRDNPLTDEEINDILFETTMATQKAMCPYDVAEGMKAVNIEDNGKEVVITIKIDENLYDMDLLRLSKDISKQNMKDFIRDDMAMQEFTGILTAKDRGLIYRMKGSKSGAVVDVGFTADELSKIDSVDIMGKAY